MAKILTPENPVMQFIGKIGYSIYLNLLWFICSIPIVTIGASTTALFAATERIAHDRYENITGEFFRSFRINFKQSTIVWLILFTISSVMAADAYVLKIMHGENMVWTLLTAIFLVAAAALVVVLMYIFPLMAHFENTTFAMFKNSIMIGMRFLLCTVAMALLYFGMGYLIIFVYTPLFLLGLGFCSLISSFLLSNILAMCESPDSEAAI